MSLDMVPVRRMARNGWRALARKPGLGRGRGPRSGAGLGRSRQCGQRFSYACDRAELRRRGFFVPTRRSDPKDEPTGASCRGFSPRATDQPERFWDGLTEAGGVPVAGATERAGPARGFGRGRRATKGADDEQRGKRRGFFRRMGLGFSVAMGGGPAPRAMSRCSPPLCSARDKQSGPVWRRDSGRRSKKRKGRKNDGTPSPALPQGGGGQR